MNDISLEAPAVSSESSSGFSIVIDTDDPEPPDLAWLESKAQAILGRLDLRHVALSVVVIDDARMSQMHEQFSGVPGTTDVLTFDLLDASELDPDQEIDVVEGEIYICLDEARRRASELDHEAATELLLYITHGILHLVGYDDHSPEEWRQMHEAEDRLLEQIGVGAVFNRDRNAEFDKVAVDES